MMSCISAVHRKRPQPPTSSPNKVQWWGPRRVSNTNVSPSAAPRDEIIDISAIDPIDEAHSNSTDSVFVLSTPANDQCIEDDHPKEEEISMAVAVETKPVRPILPSEGGVAVCRICHSSEKSCPFSNGEPLISACYCRGSTGLYHRTCLERWLTTSSKEKCEICQGQYPTEREPKDLKEYLRKPGSKSVRRHMISDFVCWLILTPTAVIGTWLCLASAMASETKKSPADNSKNSSEHGDVQLTTLVGLAAFLLTTYLIWSVICLRYHVRLYRRWKTRNYWIRIVLATDSTKMRRGSPSSPDSNNNARATEETVTTPVHNTDPAHDQRIGSGSAGSRGTQYSTPWPAMPRRVLVSPDTGRVRATAMLEPRPSFIPMEEIVL